MKNSLEKDHKKVRLMLVILPIWAIFLTVVFVYGSDNSIFVGNSAPSNSLSLNSANYNVSPKPIDELIEAEQKTNQQQSQSSATNTSSGQVLASTTYKYKDQFSCIKNEISGTACNGPSDSNPDGVCVNDYVNVYVEEIKFPDCFFDAPAPQNLNATQQYYYERGLVAPCGTEAEGYVSGCTAFANKPPAGDLNNEDFYTNGRLSPSTAQENTNFIKDRLTQFIAGIAGVKVTNQKDEDESSVSAWTFNNIFKSSPVALNGKQSDEERGGFISDSPVNSRSTVDLEVNECRELDSVKTDKIVEISRDDATIKQTSYFPSTTKSDDWALDRVINEIRCNADPGSAACKYEFIGLVEITAPNGSNLKCKEGQCSMMFNNKKAAALTSPTNSRVNIVGTEEADAAIYDSLYLKIDCKLKLVDNSKVFNNTSTFWGKCMVAAPAVASDATSQGLGGYLNQDTAAWFRQACVEAGNL